MPAFSSCWASLLAPCLVRLNTSTCCQSVFHQLLQHRGLVFLVHRVDPLFHAVGGGVGAKLPLPPGRAGCPGKLPDLVGEGGRENRFWRRVGQQLQDTADIVNKAHIQHTIGFVQHQDFSIPLNALALLVKISRRPGVATRISTPLRSAVICGLILPHRTPLPISAASACRR